MTDITTEDLKGYTRIIILYSYSDKKTLYFKGSTSPICDCGGEISMSLNISCQKCGKLYWLISYTVEMVNI